MKLILKSFLVMILAVGFVGCSSKPEKAPVKVTSSQAWNRAYGFYYPKLTITATDDVTVNDVVVNRGSCKRGDSGFPRELKYGSSMEVRVNSGCDLLEVKIATNKGDWSFSFQ
jgi:hypothetical protein